MRRAGSACKRELEASLDLKCARNNRDSPPDCMRGLRTMIPQPFADAPWEMLHKVVTDCETCAQACAYALRSELCSSELLRACRDACELCLRSTRRGSF